MAINSRKIMLALAILVACGGAGHKVMAQVVTPGLPPPAGGEHREDRDDDRDDDDHEHGGRWR